MSPYLIMGIPPREGLHPEDLEPSLPRRKSSFEFGTRVRNACKVARVFLPILRYPGLSRLTIISQGVKYPPATGVMWRDSFYLIRPADLVPVVEGGSGAVLVPQSSLPYNSPLVFPLCVLQLVRSQVLRDTSYCTYRTLLPRVSLRVRREEYPSTPSYLHRYHCGCQS